MARRTGRAVSLCSKSMRRRAIPARRWRSWRKAISAKAPASKPSTCSAVRSKKIRRWRKLGITWDRRSRLRAGSRRRARNTSQAIQLRARFPEAQYALANLLVKTGDSSSAMQYYLDAIRQRPSYAEAHNNLANLYADQGRFDDARSELEQALRVNPAFAEAHNNLARVLAVQKHVPEALEHARRAVVLNPGDAGARYNLGRLLQETGSQ